jgi:mono/diheme cytochrome c family protein
MNNALLFTALLLITSFANAAPFAAGDAKIGKQMAEKNCVACHASSYGGDGSEMYTRDFRKVENAKQLQQQVRNCNTNLGLKWFEEEELHVTRYLNETYYKFEQ